MKLQNGSDVRGVAIAGVPGEDVTLVPEAVNRIAAGFAKFLAKKLNKQTSDLRIAVGHDSRVSAGMMKEAVFGGLLGQGVHVTDCGLASTPAMFMSIIFEDTHMDGSIMITASHLPYNRNGLKFFTVDGGLEKSEVKEVLTLASQSSAMAVSSAAIASLDLIDLYALHLRRKICAGLCSGMYDRPLEGMHIVVDAGNSDERENARLKEFIDSRGLHPRMAVNTHGHFDHTLGVQFLKDTYGIPFALSGKDKFLLDNAAPGSSIFGVKVGAMPSIDLDLDTTDEVRFGHTALKIIPTPGHTPGHVSLYAPQAKAVFTGDTLFRESIGRTDLPGGDYSWIMRSILERLIPLGDETEVYPGHGESTTIGHESLYNPFVVEVLNGQVNYDN